MCRSSKKFIMYLGIGFLLFTAFTYITMPESASAQTVRTVRILNIRDEGGNILLRECLMLNFLSPIIATSEFINIILGILMIILSFFGVHSNVDYLAAGWSNIAIIWPGLIVWSILGYIYFYKRYV